MLFLLHCPQFPPLHSMHVPIPKPQAALPLASVLQVEHILGESLQRHSRPLLHASAYHSSSISISLDPVPLSPSACLLPSACPPVQHGGGRVVGPAMGADWGEGGGREREVGRNRGKVK